MTVESKKREEQTASQQAVIDREIECLSDIPENSNENFILCFAAVTNYVAGEELVEPVYDEGGLGLRALKPVPPSVRKKVIECGWHIKSNSEVIAAVKRMEQEIKITEVRALMFVCGAIDDMLSEGILRGPILLTDSGSSLRMVLSEMYGLPTNGEIAWAIAEVEAGSGRTIPSEAKALLYERAEKLRCELTSEPPDANTHSRLHGAGILDCQPSPDREKRSDENGCN